MLNISSPETSSSPSTAKETHHSSLESQKVSGDFADFLKSLKKSPSFSLSLLNSTELNIGTKKKADET